jgi:hypothetical protein
MPPWDMATEPEGLRREPFSIGVKGRGYHGLEYVTEDHSDIHGVFDRCLVREADRAHTTSFDTNWVKGRIFCVGDRWKGVKHSSWSTTVVARQ